MTEIFYRPLFPLVLHVYREVFFQHEHALAKVCYDPGTIKEAKDRLFELMAVRRSFNATLNPGDDTLPLRQMARLAGHFSGLYLPTMEHGGLYVPYITIFSSCGHLVEGRCMSLGSEGAQQY